uniref:Uncharacterized protein n=1 Tax=Arundo donax TaxID=35708 RepID=A0A0A8Z6J1_ARUDO
MSPSFFLSFFAQCFGKRILSLNVSHLFFCLYKVKVVELPYLGKVVCFCGKRNVLSTGRREDSVQETKSPLDQFPC